MIDASWKSVRFAVACFMEIYMVFSCSYLADDASNLLFKQNALFACIVMVSHVFLIM